jgi:hypothetical protein
MRDCAVGYSDVRHDAGQGPGDLGAVASKDEPRQLSRARARVLWAIEIEIEMDTRAVGAPVPACGPLTGVSRVPVPDADAAEALVRRAAASRAEGATAMNAASSRSHSVRAGLGERMMGNGGCLRGRGPPAHGLVVRAVVCSLVDSRELWLLYSFMQVFMLYISGLHAASGTRLQVGPGRATAGT